MAGETTLTIIGNLTADPELRFQPSGSAVTNFTVASTPKVYDRNSNEFKDGETLFMRCSVWREYAENVAESLQKGMRVIVTGRLKQRSYDHKDGYKVTVVELEVDEIGPSLRFAQAKVQRTERRDNQGNSGTRPPAGNRSSGQSDPWATPGVSDAGGGWGNGPDSEPPF